MLIDKEKYLTKSRTTRQDQASVDEIIKVCPVSAKYRYSYWLKKVKQSGKSYNDILYLIAKSGQLGEKYNRCGFINNSLSKK